MGRKLRSLIVTSAGININPTLAALASAGLDPWWSWERVESDVALRNALEATWDVLIYDQRSDVMLDHVRASVAQHVPALPIVIAASLDTLGADVLRALGD